jgi:hypothetical protein
MHSDMFFDPVAFRIQQFVNTGLDLLIALLAGLLCGADARYPARRGAGC